jgi:hypothetical protein
VFGHPFHFLKNLRQNLLWNNVIGKQKVPIIYFSGLDYNMNGKNLMGYQIKEMIGEIDKKWVY